MPYGRVARLAFLRPNLNNLAFFTTVWPRNLYFGFFLDLALNLAFFLNLTVLLFII